MKTKFNKTRAKKKLDSLFSQKTRLRASCEARGYGGVRCGGALQCAHIERRDNIRLRWDPMNSLCLCFGHHFWFHHNPLRFVEFLKELYLGKFNYVTKHRNEYVQFDEELYKKIYKKLSGGNHEKK